jgi:hypothetical protein
VLCISRQGRLERHKGCVNWIVHFYRQGRTDGPRAGWIYSKEFSFSMIRPAAAAQMHADKQAERHRADGITAMVALRSGTAEYAPLRNSLSDRNYRQGNEQDNVQGNTEEDDVPGNTRETTCRATQRKITCRATQRRTMLKTSMIKIILPQPSTRYYHA